VKRQRLSFSSLCPNRLIEVELGKPSELVLSISPDPLWKEMESIWGAMGQKDAALFGPLHCAHYCRTASRHIVVVARLAMGEAQCSYKLGFPGLP